MSFLVGTESSPNYPEGNTAHLSTAAKQQDSVDRDDSISVSSQDTSVSDEFDAHLTGQPLPTETNPSVLSTKQYKSMMK